MEAWFLARALPYAYNFGIFCFSPTTVALDFYRAVNAEFEKQNYPDEKNVVFTGPNSGGVISKIVDLKTGRMSFAFLSFSVFTDLMGYFDLKEDNSWLIVNIFHLSGMMSVQEPGRANNIIMPSVDPGGRIIVKDDKRPSFCAIFVMRELLAI